MFPLKLPTPENQKIAAPTPSTSLQDSERRTSPPWALTLANPTAENLVRDVGRYDPDLVLLANPSEERPCTDSVVSKPVSRPPEPDSTACSRFPACLFMIMPRGIERLYWNGSLPDEIAMLTQQAQTLYREFLPMR